MVVEWYYNYRKRATDRRLALNKLIVKNDRQVCQDQAVIFVSCYYDQANSQD